MRNGWKKGDFLIIDSESGMTRFSSDVRKDYTGERVTKRYSDHEQPQDFVRPATDPKPIPFANPSNTSYTISVSASAFVGNTTVPTKMGPASHLF